MATKINAYSEELDIVVEQGATFDVTLTWKDSAGDPIDITGYSARMDIRANIDEDTAIHSMTSANGDIVLGDAAGTIQLLITAADTEAFDFQTAVYDLELISGAGAVTRLIKGCIELDKEVTR